MIKVLLVEDNFSVRDTLKDFLEFFFDDLKIIQAKNGREGVEVVQNNKIDILISDQKMPDMNGSKFISQVIDKLKADQTVIYI